jgi:hypothetical protein
MESEDYVDRFTCFGCFTDSEPVDEFTLSLNVPLTYGDDFGSGHLVKLLLSLYPVCGFLI